MYVPFGLLIEAAQMQRYHKRFIFQEKVVDATLDKRNADRLHNTNLLSEGVRLVLSQKKIPTG